ncbi:MAG: 5'/3'-nucleotidase SurE [Vulcanimicrobiota bacterium]
MRVLLTNDDGVRAPGFVALLEAFRGQAEVMAVAPQEEQSAVARSITFRRPLRLEHQLDEPDCQVYAATGTPTDCVLLGLCHLMKDKPDVVVSGINRGANLGDDVLYSGTVAGAMEGSINGIPSLAVSLERSPHPDYSHAARFALELSKEVIRRGLPPKILLNVNVPARPEILGHKITRQGHTQYAQEILSRVDPRGQEYFWVTGALPTGEPEEGTDFAALAHGYVSISPLSMDLTAGAWIGELSTWEI